jgi:hypothetical protein
MGFITVNILKELYDFIKKSMFQDSKMLIRTPDQPEKTTLFLRRRFN